MSTKNFKENKKINVSDILEVSGDWRYNRSGSVNSKLFEFY